MATVCTVPKTSTLFLGTDPHGKPVEFPAHLGGKSQAWRKIAFLGISGSGKTYAAAKMVEEWGKAGVPVCVLDSVGVWWGLRAGADGSSRGGLPIPVYGGSHGDAELPNPIQAAQLFALKSQSMILDLLDLNIEEMQLWVAEFAEELMREGTRPPTVPCHLVIEEAPDLIPQTGSASKYTKRCKMALARYIRVGRNFGYGASVIAQRTDDVDKKSFNMCGTVLLMRIAAEIDRKAIGGWIANNSSKINLKQALAELCVRGTLEEREQLVVRSRARGHLHDQPGRRGAQHPGLTSQEVVLEGAAVELEAVDQLPKHPVEDHGQKVVDDRRPPVQQKSLL